MAINVRPFRPFLSGGIAPAVSATSATGYALVAWPTNAPRDDLSVLVTNLGANIVYFEFGTSANGNVATATKAMALNPASSRVVSTDIATTHVNAISLSGASITQFLIGYGGV